MKKESYLIEVYNNSFNDELSKISGVASELTGSVVNPFANYATIPAMVAAAITPTKTRSQMKEQEKRKWSNVLIPGMGTYNYFKRLGYSDKSLSKGLKKEAGVKSEYLSSLNPLNIVASIPASIAAAITPTKTKKQMEEQQKRRWSNILIPGMGTYNTWKRLGYTGKELKD